MIRGALILGVGFSLGYVKALHDSDEITSKLSQLIDLLKEGDKRRQEQKDAAETPAADVTAEAIDVTPETPVTPPVDPSATEGE